MFNIPNNDPTALHIHLNELKTLFDRAICEGKNFDQVKQIYLQIKELECQLNVMQWQGTTKVFINGALTTKANKIRWCKTLDRVDLTARF